MQVCKSNLESLSLSLPRSGGLAQSHGCRGLILGWCNYGLGGSLSPVGRLAGGTHNGWANGMDLPECQSKNMYFSGMCLWSKFCNVWDTRLQGYLAQEAPPRP